jgi:hypothetical protein
VVAGNNTAFFYPLCKKTLLFIKNFFYNGTHQQRGSKMELKQTLAETVERLSVYQTALAEMPKDHPHHGFLVQAVAYTKAQAYRLTRQIQWQLEWSK